MKIAIVGTGVSGLVTAYHLHRSHEIVVFEAADHLGGHARTVDVDWAGRTYPIDTGFVVYNERNYPLFSRLLRELGVASRPTTMSFSVCDPRTSLEYNGHSLNTLFAQRRNLIRPKFWRLLADILRFHRDATGDASLEVEETTVRDFLDRSRFSREFERLYLLPMGAAVWSCPAGDFAQFPWRFVREFFLNHGLLQLRDRPSWRVIEGGARTYVEALASGFRDRIRLGSRVRSARRFEDRVELSANGDVESFDHVVFACHADQALRILGNDVTRDERDVLGAFPYNRSTAVLRTDSRLLPRRRRAWACWNYRLGEEEGGAPCVTYDMTRLQRLDAPVEFCITLNNESAVDHSAILGRFSYEHPVFTVGRTVAQARLPEPLGRRRTSYCGAYWRNGFHEDGVVSAMAVVDSLDSRPVVPPASVLVGSRGDA